MTTAGSQGEEVFSGGCRCGGVHYTSSAPPSDITFCYCRACQQVSGSGFLPFVGVPTSSFTLVTASNLRTIELSKSAKRTFCGDCGSPITMVYLFAPESTGVTVGSIDEKSYKCEKPKIKQHIFVKEKAPWTLIPEDGVVRLDTSVDAHLIVPLTGQSMV
ncbi:hypothetical protein K505DRAFT_376577 [Melanomma pulvis-pyrius CBS 109.77]|uniref:CENP-V/GFA domain-containing protein n=1 Tax=Melanomma pulvis-pyrius CBS 109.77 TaxID=1314802 RepID=A0A6A6X615_9PLEO|nr:hypothetical protein K505DRAFT_376577 [Melanomma pulvis-pyrius CBS 109.77]